MCKLYVRVLECEFVFGEFLEANDYVVRRCIFPRSFWDECCADGFELGVVEDAFGGVFDIDFVAGVEEGFRCGGRYWYALVMSQ